MENKLDDRKLALSLFLENHHKEALDKYKKVNINFTSHKQKLKEEKVDSFAKKRSAIHDRILRRLIEQQY